MRFEENQKVFVDGGLDDGRIVFGQGEGFGGKRNHVEGVEVFGIAVNDGLRHRLKLAEPFHGNSFFVAAKNIKHKNALRAVVHKHQVVVFQHKIGQGRFCQLGVHGLPFAQHFAGFVNLFQASAHVVKVPDSAIRRAAHGRNGGVAQLQKIVGGKGRKKLVKHHRLHHIRKEHHNLERVGNVNAANGPVAKFFVGIKQFALGRKLLQLVSARHIAIAKFVNCRNVGIGGVRGYQFKISLLRRQLKNGDGKKKKEEEMASHVAKVKKGTRGGGRRTKKGTGVEGRGTAAKRPSSLYNRLKLFKALFATKAKPNGATKRGTKRRIQRSVSTAAMRAAHFVQHLFRHFPFVNSWWCNTKLA